MSEANQLSILYVSYPLLTVTPESAGGAEQMLLAVEREIARQTSHHGGGFRWLAGTWKVARHRPGGRWTRSL